jgi:hypothetical protein
VRSVVVAIALVLGLAGTAEARRGLVIVTSDTDIIHIRDLPLDSTHGLHDAALGYRYHSIGLFGLDFFRSDGEFVVYRDGDSWGLPVGDSELAELGGAGVPWSYHLPIGWIVLVGAIEVVLVTRSRRRVGVVFGIAGAMVVVAAVFFLGGMRSEAVIPLVLAGHHVVAAMLAVRHQKQLEELDARERAALGLDEPPRAPQRKLVHAASGDLPLPPPPRIGDDPFRSPPAARPIVTEKPPERPSTAPIVHDANAEQPKLLR